MHSISTRTYICNTFRLWYEVGRRAEIHSRVSGLGIKAPYKSLVLARGQFSSCAILPLRSSPITSCVAALMSRRDGVIILPHYSLSRSQYPSRHAGDGATSTSVLLLFSCRATQMSPSGLLISMREVLRKKNGREKAFQRSREFLWAWRCETTISFVTFMAAPSLTHHADSHTPRRHPAWDDSLLQLPRCPAATFPLLLYF